MLHKGFGDQGGLARLLPEGFGIQGVMGKAGGAIGRTGIAIAMAGGGSVRMRSPVLPETEQDKARLCDMGQEES